MNKETKISGCVFLAIMFAIFTFIFAQAFAQYPALQRAYVLKTEGRNVQATIESFNISSTRGYYTHYVVHYTYEEDGRKWRGIIQYSHDNRTEKREFLIPYYEAKIGSKVDITIDPNSQNNCLTKDVEKNYEDVHINEILRFAFGLAGLTATVAFFIWFMILLKKSKSKRV